MSNYNRNNIDSNRGTLYVMAYDGDTKEYKLINDDNYNYDNPEELFE